MSGAFLRATPAVGRRSPGFSPTDALADELGAWSRVLAELREPPAPTSDSNDGSTGSAAA
jgi:hypothetical protein